MSLSWEVFFLRLPLVDNNIIGVSHPGPVSESVKLFLAESSIPEYNKLSENFAIPNDWRELWAYSQYLTLTYVLY